MKNIKEHNRRSIRLKGYDYSSAGVYFVTICSDNRECLFGNVNNGKMQLNKFGNIARTEWTRTSEIRDNVVLDEFVVMPNHIHAIFQIVGKPVGACHVGAYCDTPPECDTPQPPTFKSPSNTVGAVVRGYKSAVTKQINIIRNAPGVPVWQRNYYEHIIRDEESLNRIREYIMLNPQKWEDDRNNPLNFK